MDNKESQKEKIEDKKQWIELPETRKTKIISKPKQKVLGRLLWRHVNSEWIQLGKITSDTCLVSHWNPVRRLGYQESATSKECVAWIREDALQYHRISDVSKPRICPGDKDDCTHEIANGEENQLCYSCRQRVCKRHQGLVKFLLCRLCEEKESDGDSCDASFPINDVMVSSN